MIESLTSDIATLGRIDGEIIPLALFLVGGVVAIIAIVAETVRKSLRTREREQSRREIAAYIAEGSMSPEDGVRLMAAGESAKNRCGV